MSWWDSFRKGLRDEISNTDRRVAGEVESFIEDASASGAMTDAERQAEFDKRVAALSPEERARVIAEAEDQREQLEQLLRSSGYKGDVESMTTLELARLAAERGLLDLSGEADLPTSSALAAAASATHAGGSWAMDAATGDITIYKDAAGKRIHDIVPGGQEGPPAAIVGAEIMGESDRGGARPTGDQLREAAKIQDANPGSALSFGEDGSVEVTRTDGAVITVRNNPFQQGLEDLQASAGDLRGIGDALDGAARRTIEDLSDGISAALDRAKPSFGGGAAAGMGGTGGSTGSGTPTSGSTRPTGDFAGGTDGSTGYKPPASQGSTHDPSLDPDNVDTGSTDSNKPSSTSTSTTPATTPADPEEEEENVFVERTREDDNPAPDTEDGWAPSTKKPPTDGTFTDTDENYVDDEEEDEEDESSSGGDVGYTPAPDGENRRELTMEDLERAKAAADARGGWSDRPPIKAPEYDPEFAARMQNRKLGMIGNPGDPDQDMGTPDGPPPDRPPTGGFTGPDDDTGKARGHDLGNEDPMLNQPQGTLDPSILEEDVAPPMPLQETVVAELDPALSAPLETSVEAEVNIEGTPAMPGYHYALGDPVPVAPQPEEDEPIVARTDLGGQLSFPTSFRLPTKDADGEDPDEG